MYDVDRRNFIGASEWAAILGFDPHKTIIDVWASKVHGIEVDTTPVMEFGTFAEDFVASQAEKKWGLKLTKPICNTYYKDGYSFLGASLDRELEDGTPVELKTVQSRNINPDLWEALPPIHYQIQVQAQMFVTGTSSAALIGMFFPGCRLELSRVYKNEWFMDAAITELEIFWKLVQTKTPPDSSRATLAEVKKIWPSVQEDTVELDQPALELAEQWEMYKNRGKEALKAADLLEARIREKLGNASCGKLPDGRVLYRNLVKRNGYTVKPCEYITLSLKGEKNE